MTDRRENRFESAYRRPYRRAGAWLALMGMVASVLLSSGIGVSSAAASPASSPASNYDNGAYGDSSLAAALTQICIPGGLVSGHAAVPAGSEGGMSFPAKCSHCCLALELSLGKGGNSSQPVSYPSSRSFAWHGPVAMPQAGDAAFRPFTRGPPSRI